MFRRFPSLLLGLALACGAASPPAARANVVINEIFYHAPDDLDEVQFIELHNTGDEAVELAGWKFSRGVTFVFPAKATIEASGYLVVCKDLKEFRRHYGFDATGPFTGSLSHRGEHIALDDAAGKLIDSVEYKSRAPWPVAADGYGPSLERICPATLGDCPENWAPSPLSSTSKPGGTPGKKNATYAARLPPIISKVAFSPNHAAADQEVKVEADVRASVELRAVELRYRVAGPGYEREEKTVAMALGSEGRYSATIPPQKPGQIIRFRVRAMDADGGVRTCPHENDLRPAFSCYVHEKLEPGKVPFGFMVNVGESLFRAAQGEAPRGFGFFRFGGPPPGPRGRGNSAFVYVGAKTGSSAKADNVELFDFIHVTPRTGGRKVRFHKDHTLDGMTTINLIYEHMDRFVLAEPLAYEVYRRAGNAAPRTDFVRTWIDGRPIGFQLLVEQPNQAFLRHNKLRPDGNLYKCVWFGSGLIGQHEKKTHIREGHDDLVKLVGELNRTKGDAQWEVIKKNFDVEQVINYFAVNMVLSHWDGYFNNYFTYHDVHGSGKWTMYPWDQDKTWGFHDGIHGYEVFVNMPTTFGMAGDVPPGWPKGRPAPSSFFGAGTVWWRQPGHFSGPLLANPRFRKLFLARTKELLEKVYNKEVFFPIIADLGKRVEDEVRIRAELRREDPRHAQEHLRRNLESLREHLTRRHAFLLEQEEIKTAGKFDRAELK